jgi:hypothetical protein
MLAGRSVGGFVVMRVCGWVGRCVSMKMGGTVGSCVDRYVDGVWVRGWE